MNYHVTLMAPASRCINHYRPPLSLMYVANWFTSKNMPVKIIDVPLKQIIRDSKFYQNIDTIIENTYQEMLRQLKETKTAIVGISCFSTEFEEVKRMIADIRQMKPIAKIMVGGIHPTLCPDDFKGIADIVMQGRLDNGFPNYELVDMGYYTNANPYAIRGVFIKCGYVLSSIGCPYDCSFCVAKRLRGSFGHQSLKTPEELVKEIKGLKQKYQIDGFYIIDDLFTDNWKKVITFCTQIEDEKMLWGCNGRINTLNDETIWAMAKAGCVQIDFGIERGSDEALEKLNKRQTIKQVYEILNLCKKYGIRIFANMLVNIPGETRSDWVDIERLIKNTKPDIVSTNIFRGYYGVELPDQEPSREVISFAQYTVRKYNSIWRSFSFHLSWRYLVTFIRSKQKMNYIKQLHLLIKEVINQKCGYK